MQQQHGEEGLPLLSAQWKRAVALLDREGSKDAKPQRHGLIVDSNGVPRKGLRRPCTKFHGTDYPPITCEWAPERILERVKLGLGLRICAPARRAGELWACHGTPARYAGAAA